MIRLINGTAFWTFILATVTFLLVILGWIQLRKLNKTSSAEFYHKFKNDFFNDKLRLLMFLIENRMLILKGNKTTPYFEISFDTLPLDSFYSLMEEIKKRLDNKKIILSHEVDDYLLGCFEDLALFKRKNIIDIEMIWDGFSYYIEVCLENSEIQKYIEICRDENSTVWTGCTQIYNDCKSFEKKIKIT